MGLQFGDNDPQPDTGAPSGGRGVSDHDRRILENAGHEAGDSGQVGNNNHKPKEFGCVTCVAPLGLSGEDIRFLEDNCFPWAMIQQACVDLLADREIPCAVKDALTHPERDDVLWLPEFHDTPLVSQEIWKAALDKRLVWERHPGENDLREENHPTLMVDGVRLFDVMHGAEEGHRNGLSKREREEELKAMSPAALALLVAEITD